MKEQGATSEQLAEVSKYFPYNGFLTMSCENLL